MVIEPFVRMGPPPRSLAAEANDCFMVRLRQGANRIQGCGASFRVQWRAPLGSFSAQTAEAFPTKYCRGSHELRNPLPAAPGRSRCGAAPCVAAGCDEDAARAALAASDDDLEVALVALLAGVDPTEAHARLVAAGSVREATS